MACSPLKGKTKAKAHPCEGRHRSQRTSGLSFSPLRSKIIAILDFVSRAWGYMANGGCLVAISLKKIKDQLILLLMFATINGIEMG